MKPEQDLDHCRHDPGLVLAPGLFRGIQRGDYKRLKLDITYEFGKDTGKETRLEFKGAEPLGAPELRVLQGLIAMAGPNNLRLSAAPKTSLGIELRAMLEPKFDALHADALVIRGSYRALARAIGYADTENTKRIQKSIERLYGVTIFCQMNGSRMGSRLLSCYSSDSTQGRLHVALNPRLALAILGEARYCRIDLEEVRAIKKDPTRLIHQRLCGFINAGKQAKTSIETLCAYVWPEPTNPVAMRQRCVSIRKSLTELESIGWGVTEYSRCKFEIFRPASTH